MKTVHEVLMEALAWHFVHPWKDEPQDSNKKQDWLRHLRNLNRTIYDTAPADSHVRALGRPHQAEATE